MNRKATPDILGNLMGEATKQEDNTTIMEVGNKEIDTGDHKTISEENNKTTHIATKKAIRQPVNKAINTAGNKKIKKSSHKATPTQLTFDGIDEPTEQAEEELKKKATFNLPVKLLGELEEKWYEIRKLCGSKQISKTLIVEEALRMAFAEFDLKKHIGKFYGSLVSNKAIKE